MDSSVAESFPAACRGQRIAELYCRHAGELVRFLARRLGSEDLANDLVQELFLRLLGNETGVAGIRHDRGFLYCAARHLALEVARAPRWRDFAAESEVPAELGESAPSPEALYAARQGAAALLATIGDLPPRCREAFLLHKFDGLPQTEVASRLGISLSSVEKHMSRALAACRGHLDQRAKP